MGADGSLRPAARLRPAALRLAPPRPAVRAADQGAVRALPRPLPLPARGALPPRHRPGLAHPPDAKARRAPPLPRATLRSRTRATRGACARSRCRRRGSTPSPPPPTARCGCGRCRRGAASRCSALAPSMASRWRGAPAEPTRRRRRRGQQGRGTAATRRPRWRGTPSARARCSRARRRRRGAAAEGDAPPALALAADADAGRRRAADADDDDDDDNARGGEEGGGDEVGEARAAKLRAAGCLWEVSHAKTASLVVWHHKGDYLASVAPDGASRAVLLHQHLAARTRPPPSPSRAARRVRRVPPSKPLFFVATQRHVRVYAAAQCRRARRAPRCAHRRLTPLPAGAVTTCSSKLTQKLNPAVKWISSLAVHPGGDNVIVGSYDKKLCWFDTGPLPPRRTARCARTSSPSAPSPSPHASASSPPPPTTPRSTRYGGRLRRLELGPLIVPVKVTAATRSPTTSASWRAPSTRRCRGLHRRRRRRRALVHGLVIFYRAAAAAPLSR